jgi:hypothetical protein
VLTGGGSIDPSHPLLESGALVLTSEPGAARLAGRLPRASTVVLLGADPEVRAVVLPRTSAQRSDLAARALPSLLVPDRALDAQSLVALADLVISAGGTMNREAAALGVPVYTTFAGQIGAVDEQLIGERRLELLTSPASIRIEKRSTARARVERDPALLLDLLLTALDS